MGGALIESLRIRNLAVVREAVVDLAPGLNVLTGETGAGKSLILGALGLLSGARASGDAVRAGTEEASVEAILSTEDTPALERELLGRGFELEDHSLVISRRVQKGGRSRAQIGGQWVPVSALRELFAGRLEISSQHASQALRNPEDHADFLDDFGGLGEKAKTLRESYQALRDDLETLRQLHNAAAERVRQRDFLEFQCDEIDRVDLAEGEITSLTSEQRRLAHAEELGAGLASAATALSGEEREAPGALEAVERALAHAEPLLGLAPELDTSLERLRSIREEIADIAIDFSRAANRVEIDPAKLERVEARISDIETLRRKYGKEEDEIRAYRAQLGHELLRLGGDAEQAAALEAKCERGAARLSAIAEALREARQRKARDLETAVDAALGDLEMEGAHFAVAFRPQTLPEGLPCGPRGLDAIEFLIASNPGEPARPLAKVASGGELSRVFLALKNARLRGDAPGDRTLIFDEVDAGIGGKAIDRVGTLLCELGTRYQVLCITHWPQIAASASVHHRVRKRRRDGRTHTVVEALTDAERVEELARMAGGAKISEATKRHARDLLRKRRRTRAAPEKAPRAHRPTPRA